MHKNTAQTDRCMEQTDNSEKTRCQLIATLGERICAHDNAQTYLTVMRKK